jgi:hypothetical protein
MLAMGRRKARQPIEGGHGVVTRGCPSAAAATTLVREGDAMPIPVFQADGYLPEGLHFMIRSETEYEGAQRELRYLKEFLSRTESAPDHPNKELGIIGIYKKMYRLWEELEEYYGARLSEAPPWESADQPVETASSALSGQGVSAKS